MVYTNGLALKANISEPAKCGGGLNGDPGLDIRGQDGVLQKHSQQSDMGMCNVGCPGAYRFLLCSRAHKAQHGRCDAGVYCLSQNNWLLQGAQWRTAPQSSLVEVELSKHAVRVCSWADG